jgi:hypothetical protein
MTSSKTILSVNSVRELKALGATAVAHGGCRRHCHRGCRRGCRRACRRACGCY